MIKLDIKNQTETFVNNYIDKLASESNGITQAEWNLIKTKINYSIYYKDVKEVLKKHCTRDEIRKILEADDMVSPINDTGKLIYKPKPEVTKELYYKGEKFGIYLNNQIKELIK
tara:strand:- start:103 stop:444 length:342 start_codon:yes stop_codon:yes gene_type:complete